jgi:hypothetical protein
LGSLLAHGPIWARIFPHFIALKYKPILHGFKV